MAIIPYTENNITYSLNDSNFEATVTGRDSTSVTMVIIPETLLYNAQTYTVRVIDNLAFSSSNITGLSLPDTITTIGYNAFYLCADLDEEDITLPSSLTSLGQFAFSGCSSLSGTLTIPSSVATIGAGAFEYCTSLSSIVIEEGVAIVSDQLARGCTGLTGDLTIPNSVTSIGTSAFNGCTGLTGVLSIGENVQSIGNYAFAECNFSSTIYVPESVTGFYYGVFSQGHVEYDSFKNLVEIDLDLDDLTGLPDPTPLEERLEVEYEDMVTNNTSHSYIYKSANIDEIEINYAQSVSKGYDFMFVLDISDSMQNTAQSILGGVNQSYPRMTYATQVLDQLSQELLDTDYDNRVAITTFSAVTTTTLWDTGGFVSNYQSLRDMIWDNYAWKGNGTDYSDGINSAIQLINNRSDVSRDVAVIFISDGKPNQGNVDAHGVYGGNEAQILRNMNVPLYPVSIFLSDTELADARVALTAISYDKATYYEARDVDSFQNIITEVIGDVITEMDTTIIRESFSQYFEARTATITDLIADCGTAWFDGTDVMWDLTGCSTGVIHSLKIMTKVVDENIPVTDYYPTNSELGIDDPCGTSLNESPEIYITRNLSSSKEVVDENGDGMASPGELLTYTIVAVNGGDVAFNNLLIKDTLSDLLPYLEDTTGVRITVNIDGQITYMDIEELINGFVIDLEAGKSAIISFSVNVAEDLDTSEVTVLSNTSTVGEESPSTEIPVLSNSEYFAVKSVKNEMGEDVDGATVSPGDILTYTIRATAISLNEPIGPIVFIDEISEFIEHMGEEDTVTTMSGETFSVRPTYSASVMSVDTAHYLNSEGDWIEVSFFARVKENTGGNKVLNQSLVSAGLMERETNLTEVNIFQLEGDPVKSVSSTSESGVGGSIVKVGDEITYEIEYTNYETTSATILISDKLFLGVDFVSATDGGIFNEASRAVEWTIQDVPADSSGTVFLVVRVNKNASSVVGNYAEVRVGDNAPRFTNYVENPLLGACKSFRYLSRCRRSIKGQKIWQDGNNIRHIRPPATEIILTKDGELQKSVMVDSLGDGRYQFDCLPIWNNKKEFNYQVDEAVEAEGYTKRIDGYNVINTIEPSLISISGTKIWNDDNNNLGLRPLQITVTLLQNGTLYRWISLLSPPDTEDTASFNFDDVPQFDSQGNLYVYSIGELEVAQYITEINGFTITNTIRT